MEKKITVVYVKMPLKKLARLCGVLLSRQIPFSYNAGIELRIELVEFWERAFYERLKSFEKECIKEGVVFEVEKFEKIIEN